MADSLPSPEGRPLKFETVADLDRGIEKYFSNTPQDEWTWTGLALSLDTDKWTLKNYVLRDEYSASIKKALLKVENGYEIDLKKSGRSGTIFALKNFDWKDKNETDVTSKGEKVTGFVVDFTGAKESSVPIEAPVPLQ